MVTENRASQYLALISGLTFVLWSATSHVGAADHDEAHTQDQFWSELKALCGQAFSGELSVFDAQADASWLNQPLTIHVWQCNDQQIKIPLVVGDDRSRTWVLTKGADGIELKHDHRHEDGSDDVVTWYGGKTTDRGTHWRQAFPVDQYSRSLFFAEGLEPSVDNVWYLELRPGQYLAYGLTRPSRHFQARFDLTQTVAAPAPPWGHE